MRKKNHADVFFGNVSKNITSQIINEDFKWFNVFRVQR